MTEEPTTAEQPPEEHGITEEDLQTIAAYLEKPSHERSLDDLRRFPET